MDVADDLKPDIYKKFQSVDSFNYVDLYFGVNLFENTKLSLGIQNVFDTSPPVVGNNVGTTAYNAGNTFPSLYDTLGTVYTLGVNVKF
jgi:outer membrane receptor protein involved in Fe transport